MDVAIKTPTLPDSFSKFTGALTLSEQTGGGFYNRGTTISNENLGPTSFLNN